MLDNERFFCYNILLFVGRMLTEGKEVWKLYSVREWVKNWSAPQLDLALSPRDRTVERMMAERMGVEFPQIGYTRYRSILADVVAHEFARRVGALDIGFEARLTNSGMAAVEAVVEAAEIQPGDNIARGEVLYSMTPQVLERRRGLTGGRLTLDVLPADAGNFFDAAKKDYQRYSRRMFFFETIGNGRPMPVFEFDGVLRDVWRWENTWLVLDNTFLTCVLFNPFAVYARVREEFGEDPRVKFVYVESLSKHYRAHGGFDHAPGGIVIGPKDFIAKCDEALQFGGVMTTPTLLDFPYDLYDAAAAVMPQLSRNAAAAAEFLRGHSQTKEVWYPDLAERLSQASGAGGVLFFEAKVEQPGFGERVLAEVIPPRASFGHDDTTHVDFGSLDPKFPPGLIRLAVGARETPQEVVSKLEACLGRRP